MSKSVRAAVRELNPIAVLGAAGLSPTELEARHGWSNRAWVGGAIVVRVSSGRLDGSLTHERRVVELVRPHGIPVADVIATGTLSEVPGHDDEAGEWLVSRRLPGATLSVVWPQLDAVQRRRVGVALGSVMRSLHAIDTGPVAPPWWTSAHERDLLRNAYRPRVTLGPALVEAARALPDSDHVLLDEALAFIDERVDLFAGDVDVLVHGDLHGHNILVATEGHARISGILDWEGARTGPPDLELDMFLRWVTAAHDFAPTPGGPNYIERDDCLELLAHVAEGYPAVFATPHLRSRLEVYDALWHLVQLLFDAYWRANDPPAADRRSPNWQWLRYLLDGNSPVAGLNL